MSMIGVLFDIEELDGGLYGYKAYRIFFASVDTRQLAGCSLSDGDTTATLFEGARQYCIRVSSFDPSQIAAVRNALSKSSANGLLPLASRFLDEPQVQHEPLVLAAHVGATGELVDCKTGWVTAAWKETQAQHHGSPSSSASSSLSAPDSMNRDAPPSPERSVSPPQ